MKDFIESFIKGCVCPLFVFIFGFFSISFCIFLFVALPCYLFEKKSCIEKAELYKYETKYTSSGCYINVNDKYLPISKFEESYK